MEENQAKIIDYASRDPNRSTMVVIERGGGAASDENGAAQAIAEKKSIDRKSEIFSGPGMVHLKAQVDNLQEFINVHPDERKK